MGMMMIMLMMMLLLMLAVLVLILMTTLDDGHDEDYEEEYGDVDVFDYAFVDMGGANHCYDICCYHEVDSLICALISLWPFI